MAARQIIVLDVAANPSGFTVRVALWLIAPASRVLTAPGFVSAVPLAATVSWGATAAEVAALAAGTTVEQVASLPFTTGTTQAAAEAAAIAAYTAAQAGLNADAPAVHWIGAFYNGTSWTAPP